MCKKREAYEWHSSACFIPEHVHIPRHTAVREKLDDPDIRQSFYLEHGWGQCFDAGEVAIERGRAGGL